MPQNHFTPTTRQNASSTYTTAQQRQSHSMMTQQPGQKPSLGPQIQKLNQESFSNIAGGSGPMQLGVPNNGAAIKSAQAQPSGTPPIPESNHSMNPVKGFYSARAVDMLRDNPSAAQSAAPQFDPHFESPSIRKTAGVDHSKSLPITKPMLAATSNTHNNRDFVNPSSDMHRRIGAPGGNGMSSPIGRGQSTSSYRPLTRPNGDLKPVGNNVGSNGGSSGQIVNEKRPPLSDLTNASYGATIASATGPGNSKRSRVLDGENANITAPQR
jgi:DNA repair and recombination protein RAD52